MTDQSKLRPAPSQICGACGEPWTGQTCAQKDNGWPHEVCFPVEAPSPAPSQSDEERAREVVRGYANNPNMGAAYHATISLIATVRAEATLAGAAAEKEACATLAQSYDPADKTGTEVALFIGMAIRARNGDRPPSNAELNEILEARWYAALSASPAPDPAEAMRAKCEDCPPLGYPTDETRCLSCPRRAALKGNGERL